MQRKKKDGDTPLLRALLHYVFRVGNRQKAIEFYTKELLMKVLRHEEFEEGCEATCNGPYAGKWSKTMVGYGHEKDHFVLENHVQLRHWVAIYIESDSVYDHLKDKAENGPESSLLVRDPDGHKFYIHRGKNEFPVRRVALNTKSLSDSKAFWKDVGMEEVNTGEKSAPSSSASWNRQSALNRGTAFGRIAFTYPTADTIELQLKEHQERIRKINEHFIQKEHVKLDTPGKESVYVVIMRDPNDHEICFVGDKEYWALAQIDPEGEKLLKEAIEKDDSDEYYEKKGKEKPAAK
ncbi:Glyoxalase-like domain-containing protein [Aphelenchoides fujianensis]|nr:Glyoxalase-like domain-containing protein [Aphelenchoides fujianensis]